MVTSTRERSVPWLVAVGGLLVGVGWIVGVTWLWSSHTWTRKQKVTATLLFPGGIVLPIALLWFSLATTTSDCIRAGGPGQPTVTHCAVTWPPVATPNTLLLIVLVAVPVFVGFKLEMVRRSRH